MPFAIVFSNLAFFLTDPPKYIFLRKGSEIRQSFTQASKYEIFRFIIQYYLRIETVRLLISLFSKLMKHYDSYFLCLFFNILNQKKYVSFIRYNRYNISDKFFAIKCYFPTNLLYLANTLYADY